MAVLDRKVPPLQRLRELWPHYIPALLLPQWRSPFAIAGLAIAITVFSSAWLFSGSYFPVVDTGWSYEFFSYALTQIRATGSPPLWLPNLAYGISGDFFWLTAVGPSQYLFLLIGKLTNFSALSLFLTSIAVDQFYLFLGVVLVSQRLFADRMTVFFYAVIGSALILVIDNQIFWNFRLFQMMPLAVYFLIMAVDRSRMVFVAMALVAILVFSFGSLVYTLPFQAYTLLLFFIVLIMLQAEPLRKMSSLLSSALEPANLVVTLVALVVLSAVVWLSHHVQTQFAYVGPGREHGLQADLAEYLTWGHYTELSKFVELTTAQPINDRMDFTSFFGATGLVLLIYAALVERAPIFRAFLAMFVWICAFSVATSGIAHIAYYLPGMSYFRHIGYVVGSMKWIAIEGAAFGLARLQAGPVLILRLLIAINIVIALFICAELWYFVSVLKGSEWLPGIRIPPLTSGFHIVVAVSLLLSLCGALYCVAAEKPWLYKVMIILALGELIGYRAALHDRYPVDPADRRLFANAASMSYRPERHWPSESAVLQHFRSVSRSSIHYDIDAAFTDVDLCGADPDALLNDSNLTLPGVKDLLSVWENGTETAPASDTGSRRRPGRLIDRDPQRLLAGLGCHAAKMRLVAEPILAANEQAARDLIASHPDIFSHPVIVASDAGAIGAKPSVPAGTVGGRITIDQFSADAVRATVDNPGQQSVWLVYDDAFSPGWTASIDERPSAISIANLAFKAIPIPPGRHEVYWAFEHGVTSELILLGGAALFIVALGIAAAGLASASQIVRSVGRVG